MAKLYHQHRFIVGSRSYDNPHEALKAARKSRHPIRWVQTTTEPTSGSAIFMEEQLMNVTGFKRNVLRKFAPREDAVWEKLR